MSKGMMRVKMMMERRAKEGRNMSGGVDGNEMMEGWKTEGKRR